MLSWISHRLGSRDTQRGITLIELLVTMMIFSLIMVMVSGFFMGASKTINLSTGITQNTKTASNAMSAVSRAVRAATNNPVLGSSIPQPAFQVAKSDEIVFYAYVNLSEAVEQPVMYRFYIDRTTGKLYESQWASTSLGNGRWGFPVPDLATATYTRALAETISPASGSDRPFTFVLDDGTEPVPAAGGLTLPNRQKIIAVRVSIGVQSSLTDDSKRVTLMNLVGMPNVAIKKAVD